VREYFADRGYSVIVLPEAIELLITVEGERYHPHGAERSAALAKQAAELLRRIETNNDRP
jgi:hypothetical protein